MAWKKLAFTDEVMTNPATADLDMGNNDIVDVLRMFSHSNTDGLIVYGGDTVVAGSIALYGKDHVTVPGAVSLEVPDAAGTSQKWALRVYGMSNTPKVTVAFGVDMSSTKIESLATGTNAADAIRKDQALLLVGTQAMQGDLNFNKKNADAMCIQPLASAPSTPGTAQVYYNTGDDHLYVNAV